MVPRWRFFATFLRPVFSASRVQQVSYLHLKFPLRPHTMCESMIDIQSATAKIRRGKKKKEETGRKYICPHPAIQGGHKNKPMPGHVRG